MQIGRINFLDARVPGRMVRPGFARLPLTLGFQDDPLDVDLLVGLIER